MRSRVLIVAQPGALPAELKSALISSRYLVEQASNETAARHIAKEQRCDAIIVAPTSFELPQLTFLRDMQAIVTRLVIVVDDPSWTNLLVGFFPNALIQPSLPLESEKILSFLRRRTARSRTQIPTSGASRIHFAGCELDISGYALRDATGQEVKLTHHEFNLLVAFVRNPGRALSRSDLRNAIHGRVAGAFDRSIDMLVARVRRKLKAHGVDPRTITTIPGLGYKFVTPVIERDF
jgi:two-component system, OmpR family, response regulator